MSRNETRVWLTLPVIGNESVPIQVAQCRFPGLEPMLKYFSNEIYGSNFIKQQSETVMVWNHQNADCSLSKKLLCYLLYFSAHLRSLYEPYRVFNDVGYHRPPDTCRVLSALSQVYRYFWLTPSRSSGARRFSVPSREIRCEERLILFAVRDANLHSVHPARSFIGFLCRMTNYELLRWLVEMPSRDVYHYRMINASRSTVCHYSDKRQWLKW